MSSKQKNFYDELPKRIHFMGILNVTPDSFSDGGKFSSLDAAIAQAEKLIADGADIIDVGGESTRPGAESVSVDEELSRTIPVIEKIIRYPDVVISIDTYKSQVAEAALQAGAQIVNDISGLTFDPAIAHVVARYSAALVLMHIKGTPKNMQEEPHYDDVVEEIKGSLSQSAETARAAGVEKIIIDPGLGFGKRIEDNFVLLKNLESFQSLGFPILIGTSRKSFTGKLFNLPPNDRLEGTIATNVIAAMKGANILRVHDVKSVRRAVELTEAILKA